MFNFAVLTGRMVQKPELKSTQNGVSVTSFTLAVARPYVKDRDPETDFINCVAWRNTAEFICRNFDKGNMLGVQGSFQMRKYDDKDGNHRTAFEVVVEKADFVEKKSTSVNVEKDELPELEKKLEAAGFVEMDSEDDLPF